MSEVRRVAVTLVNGRSHSIRVPDDVEPEQAARVLRGELSADEASWRTGAAGWIAVEEGGTWIKSDAIVEIAVVNWSSGVPGESPY